MAKPKTRVKRRDPDRMEFAKAEDLLRRNPRVVAAALRLRRTLTGLARRGGVKYAVLYAAFVGLFVLPDDERLTTYWFRSPRAWKRRPTAQD